jgi:paraquat-inducible protein B
MAITHDLIAKAGAYKDKQGNEKVRWHKCGVAMETKNGGIALNIESLPTNFDGWIQMREPLPKDNAPRNQNAGGLDEIESDIPF